MSSPTSHPLIGALFLPDATATETLGKALAPLLRAGDVLLLTGPIGAGKTHFARALIQSLLAVPEDIPSPTFTLVQVYEAQACEIWHADLYRLNSVSEVDELGLIDAFESAICLVEWPDRLGAEAPARALDLQFYAQNEGCARAVELRGDAVWAQRLVDVLSAKY